MKLFIAFGVCAGFSSHAQDAAKKTSTSGSWVRAIVVTDGAAVYAKNDFDSEVQDYLSYQTQVTVSRRPFAGAGGLGLFHRIHYQGKTGFITDTDIKVSKKEIEKAGSSDAPEKSRSKAFKDEPGFNDDMKPPLYLTRFLGGAVSMVNFTEKYSGRKLSDNVTMYGLRMTGPGTLFDGPPLDFNFWFSVQKPKYLSNFATGSPTGFMIFGDVMAMLPLIDVNNTIVSYGLGLMYTYTKFSIPVKKSATGQVSSFDSQEFRIGAVAGLGVGQRIFKKHLIRADVKYYYEKTTYLGYGLSYQVVY